MQRMLGLSCLLVTLFVPASAGVEPQDSSLLLRNVLTQYWNGIAWGNTFSTGNAYDGNLHKAVQSDSQWNGDAYVEYQRTIYANTAAGLLLEEATLAASRGWDTLRAFNHAYDPEGRRVESVTKYWDFWAGSYLWLKVEREYDTAGQLVRESALGLDGNTWRYYSRWNSAYDSRGNRVSQVMQYWFEDDWRNSTLSEITYDTAGKRLGMMQASWNADSYWDTLTTIAMSYDPSGFLIGESRRVKDPDSGVWTDADLSTYSNDVDGRVVTALFQYWADSVLTNGNETHYVYSPTGKPISVTEYFWMDGGWVPGSLRETEYDAQDNTLSTTSWNWQDTGWVGESRFLYSYQWLTTAVEPGVAPATFSLSANYPNPFNPATTIEYSIANAAMVRITVYNVLGELVAVPVDEHRVPGSYRLVFDASALPGGVYYYRIDAAGRFGATRKMLLVK